MMETLLNTSYAGDVGAISGAESFADRSQCSSSSSLSPLVRTTSKHRVGQQRGSLPLKKRLRYDFSLEGFTSSTDEDDNENQKNRVFQPHSSLQEQDSTTTTPPDLPNIYYSRLDHSRANGEKLAALALIAAAATSESALDESSRSSNSSSPPSLPPLRPETPLEASQSSLTALTCLAVPKSPCLSLPEGAMENTPTHKPCTPRSNRGRLAQPLANGCHFRTSRNNAFCRRHPCYNESNYCKLHYHHYKIAVGNRQPHQQDATGADATAEQLLSIEATLKTVLKDDTVPGAASSSVLRDDKGFVVDVSDGTTSVEAPQASMARLLPSLRAGLGTATILPPAHQDRRFASATNGEPRCLATTTRGRPCAYIAVSCTKYCYLHAEYDTHPPPKRGGACQQIQLQNQQLQRSKTQEKTVGTETDMVPTSAPKRAEPTRLLSGSAKQPLSSSSSSSSSSAGSLDKDPSTGLHEESSSSALPAVPPRAPLSELHAGLSLLSMISSDRWFQKIVIVAAGPLINRTGTVEKWGNGWVTVRIPDMGVHNRRSFELYLHPDQQDDDAMQVQQLQSKDASRPVDPELAIHDSHLTTSLTAPVVTSQELEDHLHSASASCFSSDRSCDSTTSSRFGPMVDREEAMHTPIPEASSLLLFLQNKHTTTMVTPILQKEMGHAGGSSSNNNMSTKNSEWGSDWRKAGLVDVPHIVSPLGAIKEGLHLVVGRDGLKSAPTEL